MNTDLTHIEDFDFEPLTPTSSAPGSVTGPRISYSTRQRGKRKAPRLIISMRPDLVKDMGIAHGEFLRIDISQEIGVARLQALEYKCATGASRAVKVLPSGRATWTLSRTGLVETLFPEAASTELNEIGTKDCAVFFNLPSA